ncbi:ribosomal L1 domain-containing protein CG13096-like [Sabethes cyaneus]|uniref:ribosomal L1 domain-containing protein CG13096-like n=1 Tax=Sabethes cyaneus TaxID=53552 RepID=UPI00237EABB4|nr:ribosomal L1 domain-containing protein CG13096-like [Sabethes cyaneus]
MKIKSDKKLKKKDSKLLSIKKTSKNIAKPKEKKSAVKAAPVVLPATFAEQKVLSVKKKNKQKLKVPAVPAVTAVVPVKPSKPESTEKSKKKKQKVQNVVVPVQKAEIPKGPDNQKAKKLDKASKKTPKVTNLPKAAELPETNEAKAKKDKKSKKVADEAPAAVVESDQPAEVPDVLVTKKTIQSALKACKKALEGGFEQKKNLFGEDMRYALQISSVKIPDVPSRNCRMNLPNPIYKEGDDICLIVKDLERGSKQDYEPTLHYWQDKLRDLGIDYVSMIIPFQQLKQDYRQYEMKLKLVHRFDRFLVDARISGHVYGFLGTGFIRRCKNPTPVVLDKDKKIVKNFNKALCRFTYKQTNTGRTTEIQFANHKMPLDKAVQNAEALIGNLKTQFPGGWLNIRTIYLKPMVDIKLSLPLYVSKIDPNLVPVPKVPGPREKFEKKMSEKLLQSTRNKYEFQSGSLVRHNLDERRKLDRKGKQPKNGKKKDEEQKQQQEAVEQHSDDDDDVDMETPLGKASDTEDSDLADNSD